MKGADARPSALVLTPHGRDAPIMGALLGELGVDVRGCSDADELANGLDDEIALVVLTEEAVRHADLRAVADFVGQQPSWSDLPFIVLTRRGGGPERNPFAGRLQQALGNCSFVERPFHPTTLLSAARTGLRGRERQYAARSQLAALEQSEAALRALTNTLEERVEARTAELRERTAERDRVWRGSRDLYVTIGRDGRCRALNPAWEGELGYKAGFLVDMRFDAVVHPEDSEQIAARWRDVLAGRDVTGCEIRIAAQDGAYRWYDWTLFSDGDVFVAVARDIDQRRARERELAETEEALRHSQKLEMIGQLTGGVAHDFNNLLSAVLGNLERLERRLESDVEGRQLIANARAGAERGATLTKRMLAFARRQELAVRPTDVGELVSSLRPLFENSLGPKIELALAVDTGLPAAMIDANQIELALLNLVVNARDAMPNGGTVTVTADQPDAPREMQASEKSYLRLAVTDTGEGMDEAVIARAIEPFYSTKGVGKGTGLGLSMVDGLAEQLGGKLRLSSELNVGTTAELWVPTTQDTIADPRPNQLPAAPEAERRARRVLVVDDDILIMMNTEAMVHDLGHDVTAVTSGADALATLEEGNDFDVVLTDYAMPKMTGAELASAISENWPELPIVLATGYAELPNGETLDLPRLTKPFSLTALDEAIRVAVDR